MLSLLRRTHAVQLIINNNHLNPNPHRSYCHSAGNLARAGNLFRAGKFFRTLRLSAPAGLSAQTELSAQRPPSLRESPDPSSQTLESTQHDSHWFPRAISSLRQAICAAHAHPRTISLYSSSVHNNVAELICESTHRTLPTQLDHTIHIFRNTHESDNY